MFRPCTRWSLVLVLGLVAGCGPASGIQPGIPSDVTAPVNPTPDMGPTPPTDAKAKK